MIYQQVGQSGQNTENEREEGIWQVHNFLVSKQKGDATVSRSVTFPYQTQRGYWLGMALVVGNG